MLPVVRPPRKPAATPNVTPTPSKRLAFPALIAKQSVGYETEFKVDRVRKINRLAPLAHEWVTSARLRVDRQELGGLLSKAGGGRPLGLSVFLETYQPAVLLELVRSIWMKIVLFLHLFKYTVQWWIRLSKANNGGEIKDNAIPPVHFTSPNESFCHSAKSHLSAEPYRFFTFYTRLIDWLMGRLID